MIEDSSSLSPASRTNDRCNSARFLRASFHSRRTSDRTRGAICSHTPNSILGLTNERTNYNYTSAWTSSTFSKASARVFTSPEAGEVSHPPPRRGAGSGSRWQAVVSYLAIFRSTSIGCTARARGTGRATTSSSTSSTSSGGRTVQACAMRATLRGSISTPLQPLEPRRGRPTFTPFFPLAHSLFLSHPSYSILCIQCYSSLFRQFVLHSSPSDYG